MWVWCLLLRIITRTMLLLTQEFDEFLLELQLRHLHFIGTSGLFYLKVKLTLLKTLLVFFRASFDSWGLWRCAILLSYISIIEANSDCCWCCLFCFLLQLSVLVVLQVLLALLSIPINCCLALGVSIPRDAFLNTSALAKSSPFFAAAVLDAILVSWIFAEYISYKSSTKVCTLFGASSSSHPLRNGTSALAFWHMQCIHQSVSLSLCCQLTADHTTQGYLVDLVLLKAW